MLKNERDYGTFTALLRNGGGTSEQRLDAIVAFRDTIESLRRVARAASELDEVAGLRGDNQLPHPEDDPGLWTARMQTAWDEIAEALDAVPEWALEEK